jgi:hypothetical protein
MTENTVKVDISFQSLLEVVSGSPAILGKIAYLNINRACY